MWRYGIIDYLKGYWNWVDVLTPTLNLIYIFKAFIALVRGSISASDKVNLKTIAAFCLFLMCLKMFYFMKLFEKPAYFLAQLKHTIAAVLGFLVMFLVLVMSFSLVFFALQQNLPEGGIELEDGTQLNYVDSKVGNKFMDAVISVYLISLGEFQTDGYSEGENKKSAWAMFLLATLALQVLFMNMVI